MNLPVIVGIVFLASATVVLTDMPTPAIRGAGNFKRVHKVTTLTLDELAALVDAMPERYRSTTPRKGRHL